MNAKNPNSPTTIQIRDNLAFARWVKKNCSYMREPHAIIADTASPKQADPDELKEIIGQLNTLTYQQACQDGQILDRSRDHAAAFIMTHFPNASYTREDDTAIPTNSAIQHIYSTWPATINHYPETQPANLSIPRNKPSSHPNNRDKQVYISPKENLSNWRDRRAAADRYRQTYLTTGEVPQSPFIIDPDNDQQLIEREGWQDFWEHRDTSDTMPPPDTDRNAIPPRWLPGQDAESIIEKREIKKIVQRLSRSKTNHPTDLIEAHAQRIFNDQQNPTIQTSTKTRDEVSEDLDSANQLIRRLGRNQNQLQEWRKQLMDSVNRLFTQGYDLSNVYQLTAAHQIIDTFTTIADPLKILIDDRDVRQKFGYSSKSSDADQQNVLAVTEATQKISALALDHPQHNEPAVATNWQQTDSLCREINDAIHRYEQPDHQAPYEIEDKQALQRTSIRDIEQIAVKTCRILHRQYDEILMMVPDQWVISRTVPVVQANHESNTEHTVEHVSERFEDKTFDEAIKFIEEAEQLLAIELQAVPELLANPPECSESDQFKEWANQATDAAVNDLYFNQDNHQIPSHFTDDFRSLIMETNPDRLTQHITGKMRNDLIISVRSAYLQARTGQWNKAIQSLTKAHEITEPYTFGKYGKAAEQRQNQYSVQSSSIRSLLNLAEPLAIEERHKANESPTPWMNLPTGPVKQLTMSF